MEMNNCVCVSESENCEKGVSEHSEHIQDLKGHIFA